MGAKKKLSRKSASNSEINARKTAEQSTSETDLQQLGQAARVIAAFLFPVLLSWSMLVPCDATSVYLGSSLPQVLLGLFISLLIGIDCAISRQAIRVSTLDTLLPLGLLIWLVFGAMLAGEATNPRLGWLGFWQFVMIAGIYYSARRLFCCDTTRQVSLGLILLGGIALSIHAAAQNWVQFPAERAAYLADPDAMLEASGLDAPPGSPMRKRFEDRFLESREPFASFALANSLATLLSAVLVLLTAVWIGSTPSVGGNKTVGNSPHHAAKFALALVSVLVTTAWILTKSRTAYVAIAIAMTYWLVLSLSRRLDEGTLRRLKIAAIVVAAVFAGCFVWFLTVDSLVLSESLYSLRFRLEYWAATAKMIADHGIFGVGLGNFQSYYPTYKLELASETIADPHNWFLDIAVCLSVPAAAIISVWLLRKLLPANQQEFTPGTNANESRGVSPLASSSIRGALLGSSLLIVGLIVLRQIDLFTTIVSWLTATLLLIAFLPLVRGLVRSATSIEIDNKEPGNRDSGNEESGNKASVGGLGVQAAAVALVVCLLASGSWQASGLALPLICLLALAGRDHTIAAQSIVPFRPGLCYLPLVASGLGFAIFIFQTWMPVTRIWSIQAELQRADTVAKQVELAERAIAADTFDTQLLGLRGQALAAQAQTSGPSTFQQFAPKSEKQLTEWLERDPIPFGNWEVSASVMLDLAAKAQELNLPSEPWLRRAAEWTEQACQRYPSDVGLQVQLAVTQWLAGAPDDSEASLQEAWRLSDATPHDDKRLNMQQVYLPAALIPVTEPAAIRSRSGRVGAEPAAEWIRRMLGLAK
ncbi:MAG TPA: hypothetical protein DDW52_16385 [Planctomycetaceae bacterium]|nr:hypothetical protein [Planctomycetaceae bacterium]